MKKQFGMMVAAGMLLMAPAASAATLSGILAENADEFSALSGAIATAGLEEALSAEGPLTLFAPNNQAFAAMSPLVTAAIERNPALLADILKYHVANGRLSSNELSDGRKITTLQGETLNVRVSRDMMKIVVNKSTVTSADNAADNGVFHVIDQVLVPHPVYVEIIKDLQGKVKKIAQLLQDRQVVSQTVEAEATVGVQ